MKILVTGASGLLGKKTMELLSLSKRFEVIGTYLTHPNEMIYKLDITNKISVEAFFHDFNFDIVIHAAALVDADYCEKDKELCENINVIGTMNLVDVCKKNGKKLLFVSSDYIFDGDRPPYTEDSAPHPVNFYGVTKLEGEEIIKKNLDDYIIIRPPLLYGDDDETKPDFITTLLKKLKNNEKIFLDNEIIKYPTLTEDIAQSILALISVDAKGIFNTGSDEGITKYQWAKKIAQFYGYTEDSIFENKESPSAPRPLNVLLDSSKIKRLNISFANIEQGLKKTFKTDYAKKFNFRIIRSKDVPLEDRSPYGGYFIKRLFNGQLNDSDENVGLYETIIRPHSTVKSHYHKNLDEILYFFTACFLVIGSEKIEIHPNDTVILPRGVPHEVITQNEEVRLLAIKIPNIVEDKRIYKH
ncbi:sugar nucleotide-binding protein [Candidatus Pacearchaeota archaeon]|nr:sugar nucleotide-binding protein [Candidatus Pacearchaeota archaeon]